MKTNLGYFSLIIICLIIYLLPIGCTTTNKLKPKTFGLDLQLESLSSNVPIQVLVPKNAETNYPIEYSKRGERCANEYVDLNDLYKNAKELIEQVLVKHKVPLSPNSEKYLKFTISKVYAESDWVYVAYLEFDVETGDGYKRHFKVQDQSPMSIERAIGATTARAVERIFQNEKIIAYIEEPKPIAPPKNVAPTKVDCREGIVTQTPQIEKYTENSTRVERQQVAPPITPSLGTQKQGVDIPPKSELPVTEKKKVPTFVGAPNTESMVVTRMYANIRSGGGNEFPIVTTVKQGDKLILLGEYGDWYAVRLENGQEGWINNRFAK